MFTTQTKFAIAKALITKRSPYYIQFYVTGLCNLKCRQCNIVETNSRLHEVTLEEIEIIARNIRSIGGGIVLLTGGEPFVRRDMHEIVRIFKASKLDVRLQTAGLATSEQLQMCYDEGARDINVSLDSLVELKQDYINAVPGSWAKAIDSLERISRIFNKKSAICSLGCVLSQFNFREIPAILEFATAIGWYVSLVPVHITTEDAPLGFRSYDDLFKFEQTDFSELEKVLQRVLQMKKDGALLFDSERFIWSAFHFLQTNQPTWRKNDVCDAPDLYFAVRPNGDFAVCCDHNIAENPPSLLAPTFVDDFKAGVLRKRCEPYTHGCTGCHYGSYPEVTISVRDPRALLERIRLSFSMEKSPILRDFNEGRFFELIQEVRARHPEVYEKPMPDGIHERLSKWADSKTRIEVIRSDNEQRERENRVRGRPPRSGATA